MVSLEKLRRQAIGLVIHINTLQRLAMRSGAPKAFFLVVFSWISTRASKHSLSWHREDTGTVFSFRAHCTPKKESWSLDCWLCWAEAFGDDGEWGAVSLDSAFESPLRGGFTLLLSSQPCKLHPHWIGWVCTFTIECILYQHHLLCISLETSSGENTTCKCV